jgi:hypothetical protein
MVLLKANTTLEAQDSIITSADDLRKDVKGVTLLPYLQEENSSTESNRKQRHRVFEAIPEDSEYYLHIMVKLANNCL